MTEYSETLGMARGPGQRLKAARQALGHDVAWASQQLNLKQSFVEGLENNDFSRLPPPVFVQGYLKNYANLLGEPEEDILREYRAATNMGSPPTQKVPSAVTKAKSVQKAERKIPERAAVSEGIREKTSGFFAGLSKKKPVASAEKREPLSGWEKAFAKSSAPKAEVPRMPDRVPEPPPAVRMPQEAPAVAPRQGSVQDIPAEPPPPRPTKAPTPRRTTPVGPHAMRVAENRLEEPLPDPVMINPDEGGLRRLKAIKPSFPGVSHPPVGSGATAKVGRMLIWVLVAGLILAGLYWGASKMGNIRIKSPNDVYQDLQSLWHRITGSEQKTTPKGAVNPRAQGFSSPSRRLPGDPPLTESLDAPVPVSSDATYASGQDSVAADKDIVLELLGSCWVEIEDASGRYRLSGELRKGEEHHLAGSPPYLVRFDRADKVRILVNGQPYDFSAHQQGGVAKFTLDP